MHDLRLKARGCVQTHLESTADGTGQELCRIDCHWQQHTAGGTCCDCSQRENRVHRGQAEAVLVGLEHEAVDGGRRGVGDQQTVKGL